jgi:predicted RNase H-like nuclease
MRAVLGIDAAWTLRQPSGVALAAERSGWHLVAVAPSYQRFQKLADGGLTPRQRPSGSRPDPGSLLACASVLCGGPIDLVAIDMPLARTAIVGRRVCDNRVSAAYGARKCGTHTPSASRPGPISDELTKGFELAGYPLRTNIIELPGLVEVYPHPALVELAGASTRLTYKASRVHTYWPTASRAERRDRLYRVWDKIVVLLEKEIAGVGMALPILGPFASAVEVKSYEDELDAIVCAWVAICVLEGRATSFGDENSAIWIPNLE